MNSLLSSDVVVITLPNKPAPTPEEFNKSWENDIRNDNKSLIEEITKKIAKKDFLKKYSYFAEKKRHLIRQPKNRIHFFRLRKIRRSDETEAIVTYSNIYRLKAFISVLRANVLILSDARWCAALFSRYKFISQYPCCYFCDI